MTTILAIDDDATTLKTLTYLLEADGFTVYTAHNGEGGITLAQQITPDLILLDVLMPGGIDGFETCRRLKAHEATHTIPVIFMTSLPEPEYRTHAFAVGAADYLLKPVRRDQLLTRIGVQLHVQTLGPQPDDTA